MKRSILTIFLIIAFASLSWAGEKTEAKKPAPGHYPVNISIFYPLSINKTKKDSVNLNLSLIYGHVGLVRGIDLAGICAVVEDDMRGIQLAGLAGIVGNSMKGIQSAGLFCIAGDRSAGLQSAGLFNITGDEFKGIQGAGLFNIVGDRLLGLQLAGIGNISGDTGKGFQAAGILNIVGDRFAGFQGAGIFNMVGDRFAGVQASGIINFVGGSLKGIQSAGIINFAGGAFSGIQSAGAINFSGGEFKGLQAGTVNFAAALNGLQVGVVNLSGDVKGVQLGLVNIADQMTGTPVGLVNIARNGRIRWISWGSSIMAINTGLKFMVRNVYSIVFVGTVNLEEGISSTLAYGFHYGLHFPLKKLYLEMDLGYANIDNKEYFRSAGEIDWHFLSGRAALGVDISRHMSIFAGGGIGYRIDHKQDFDSGSYTGLFFAGIELFNFNFLSKKGMRSQRQD